MTAKYYTHSTLTDGLSGGDPTQCGNELIIQFDDFDCVLESNHKFTWEDKASILKPGWEMTIIIILQEWCTECAIFAEHIISLHTCSGMWTTAIQRQQRTIGDYIIVSAPKGFVVGRHDNKLAVFSKNNVNASPIILDDVQDDLFFASLDRLEEKILTYCLFS